MKQVCFVAASDMTIKAFMLGHIRSLSRYYRVSVAVNAVDDTLADILEQNEIRAEVYKIPLVRQISPIRDIQALFALFRLFRRCRFDVVHSISPKAGLLCAMAGWMARIPHRVHIYTGQVWATKKGLQRWLLKMLDRLTGTLATNILVDSPSQRSFLLSENVIREERSISLADGSVGGVDTDRFGPDEMAREKVREELGIGGGGTVFLFLGRLNRDKGVTDLALAFSKIAGAYPDIWLLIVGPDEKGMLEMIKNICEGFRDRIRYVPYTDTPESYMAAADVFCLPSYREGFGNVIIEAASVGVPSIGSDIYGIRDAIKAGETGLLHTAGDANEIAEKMKLLIENDDLRREMGMRARKRAMDSFSNDRLENSLVEFYGDMMREK